MEQDIRKLAFDKVLMTGVFVGIIVTVVSLFFDAIFLESTGFPFTVIINVSSLIFSVNLLFLAMGPIYYGFMRLSRYGNLVYMILFALLTLFLLWKVRGVNRTDDPHLNSEFRELLSVLIIIVGAGVCLAIPILYRSKGFRKHVV